MMAWGLSSNHSGNWKLCTQGASFLRVRYPGGRKKKKPIQYKLACHTWCHPPHPSYLPLRLRFTRILCIFLHTFCTWLI